MVSREFSTPTNVARARYPKLRKVYKIVKISFLCFFFFWNVFFGSLLHCNLDSFNLTIKKKERKEMGYFA